MTVGALVESLLRDPIAFRKNGGYDRLIRALRRGESPEPVKAAILASSNRAGDLRWVVAELEEVEPYAQAAASQLRHPDVGTSAYALEIVLRGATEPDLIRRAFRRLDRGPAEMGQHAAQTLGWVELRRLKTLVSWVGDSWSRATAAALIDEPTKSQIEALLTLGDRRSKVVGLSLLVRWWDGSSETMALLDADSETWVHRFGEYVRTVRDIRLTSAARIRTDPDLDAD